MDEKRALSPPRALRRNRPVATVVFCLVVLYTFWQFHPIATPPIANFHPGGASALGDIVDVHESTNLVPLEAHIISKCPDTKHALRQLLLPVMQRVHNRVNFTLSFIGHPTANDGVECKHGPEECMGNIIELCARELYPDPKISLGFVMCLTRDYEEIPSRALIEDCALEHAIDFQALNDCATKDDGAYGVGLLRSSIQRTAEVCFLE
ncbi:hypothetical protein EDB81DRAFT_256230 [Dactylonectria macrodidyma]|uniref:Gamma interferon inducible lysosomal thiol reductase GILT n=1 Tax=Dactylonectria macrodidyma TaxID=307937 RepID=A0A9P9FKD9_9HYPO|nr:hypothetical protein EDB81DRAFT_256230 [Dactylonectria macrodidyma]